MKSVLRVFTFLVVCLLGLLIFIANDHREVLIESQESKTAQGGPVFNKIKWFQLQGKDVWMMNQSHHGFFANENTWDRLAIVVDKTKTPRVARFYQFESGPLEWREDLVEKPFQVSCFICHNNGPRTIRANYDSSIASVAFKDRVKISYWNLQIKLYGRVLASPQHDELDKSLLRPFRYRSAFENETLKVAICIKCHKDSGLKARGELRRQQVPTIKFMLESGHMPPFGFSISDQEKREIKLFLDGF